MKKKALVLTSLLSAFLFGNINIKAQDSLQVSVGADLVSKYVWRGMDQGYGVSVMPNMSLSYKGLTLSVDATASVAQFELNEIDLSLSYEIGNFTIGVTDYYSADSDSASYGHYTTDHNFELNLSYFISDDFPLTLSWNTMFTAGKNDEYNDEGKRMYSSYFNVAYDFDVHGITLTPAIGITPWESQYYEKFGVLDITLMANKEIKITDNYSLPIYAQAIVSPALDKVYLVFGLSF